MNHRTIARVVFCLIVILAIGAPYAMGADPLGKFGAATPGQVTKVTVLFPGPSAIDSSSFCVALGAGYFKEEGLDITYEAVDGSSQVLQGLSSGKAQIGRPGPGPTLAARGRGVDVVYFYRHFPKNQFALVVKEGSPYKVPADLKGKVVGIGTADSAEVPFVRSVLTDAGMKENVDYKFLIVGDGGTAAVAFLRGDIEGYAASMFDAATVTVRGIPLREITPEKFLTYFGSGFVALGPYIKEHPDVIKGFGRALVRGTMFVMDKANKEKVLEYCKRVNPQEGEDRALCLAFFDKSIDRMTPLDRDKAKGWGYNSPEDWKTIYDSNVASGYLKPPLPKLEETYTNEFVDIWNGK